MKIENQESKDKLIKRLRRIEGQLRGVQKMVEEERDCREVTQQLSAISSAVRSTSRTFFEDYAALCLMEIKDDPEKHQGMLAEMLDLLEKTP